MASLNKVMLMGRLTNDPETKSLNGGSKVATFRFAVGRSKKNAEGVWESDPNTLYIDCEAFSQPDAKRDLVGLIEQYVKKGDQLFLEGELRLDQWEDKNGGGQRSKHKLIVRNLEFLGGNGNGGSSEKAPAATAPAPKAAKKQTRKAPTAPPADEDGTDDPNNIPF